MASRNDARVAQKLVDAFTATNVDRHALVAYVQGAAGGRVDVNTIGRISNPAMLAVTVELLKAIRTRHHPDCHGCAFMAVVNEALDVLGRAYSEQPPGAMAAGEAVH